MTVTNCFSSRRAVGIFFRPGRLVIICLYLFSSVLPFWKIELYPPTTNREKTRIFEIPPFKINNLTPFAERVFIFLGSAGRIFRQKSAFSRFDPLISFVISGNVSPFCSAMWAVTSYGPILIRGETRATPFIPLVRGKITTPLISEKVTVTFYRLSKLVLLLIGETGSFL